MKKLLAMSMLIATAFIAQSASAVDCSGLPTWNSSSVYVGGDKVRHEGSRYRAKWWTQNQNPTTNSSQWAVWANEGPCDGGGSSSGGSSSGGSSSGGSSSGGSSSGGSSSGGSSSGGSSSGGSGGSSGGCAPQYVDGASYNTGDEVTNNGTEYRCTVGGWCSIGGPYEPGVGWAWSNAWESLGPCGGGSSSSGGSSSGGSSSGGSSSGGSSSGGSGGSSSGNQLPRHALVGYWHNFTNPSGPAIRIAQVPDVWDVIVVAFADDAGNGNVAFNLDSSLSESQFKADVAAKQAQGKIVVLSFGGELGTVTLNNSTHLANFVNSTTDIMNEYGFDGIDIDLESGAGVLHGAPVIQNIVNASKQLQSRFGSGFYLSMAPEHPYVQGGHVAYSGIWGAYLPMIDGLRNELDLLHVQLYNNGGLDTPWGIFPAGTVDMLTASIKMLHEGFPLARGASGNFAGLPASKLALGLPSGPSSAGSGQASNSTIIASLNCITRGTSCGSVSMSGVEPSFRGVMTWSINWDEHDGRIFSGPIGNAVHSLP